MLLKVIAQLPIALFDEAAYGTEPLPEIFVRHGYTEKFAEECREDPKFQRIVNDRRVELEKSGLIHVNRAAAVADMALSELGRRVLDPATPTPVLLSVYQTAAKLGRLEAPTGQVAVQGSGFSISINLNPTVQTVEKNCTVIEHDPLEVKPAYLSNLNQDLEIEP